MGAKRSKRQNGVGSRRNTMTSKKKVLLVTGAGKRIGKEIVLRLSKDSYKFVIHFNKSRKDSQDLIKEIEKNGGEAKSIQFDLSKTAHIEKFAKSCEKLFGQIDILINNASIFKSQNFWDIKEKDFDDFININLKAPFLLSKYIAKGMKKRKYGKIINITDSIGTGKTWKNYSSYCISKGGLETMTKVLSLELNPYIQVNSIAPGAILKPVRGSAKKIYKNAYNSEKALDSLVNSIRLLLNSDFITGESIHVDGGERLI